MSPHCRGAVREDGGMRHVTGRGRPGRAANGGTGQRGLGGVDADQIGGRALASVRISRANVPRRPLGGSRSRAALAVLDLQVVHDHQEAAEVPVADQEPFGAVAEVHEQVAGLLGHPGPGGVGGDSGDVHAAAAVRRQRRPTVFRATPNRRTISVNNRCARLGRQAPDSGWPAQGERGVERGGELGVAVPARRATCGTD